MFRFTTLDFPSWTDWDILTNRKDEKTQSRWDGGAMVLDSSDDRKNNENMIVNNENMSEIEMNVPSCSILDFPWQLPLRAQVCVSYLSLAFNTHPARPYSHLIFTKYSTRTMM